jgi:hypothetical protein
MILSELDEFADATALSTSGTGRQLVGDVIDLSVARDIGMGAPLYFVLQVVTAFTSGGAATVQFELASDAQAAIATDGTATEHFTSSAFALASLTANAILAIVPIPLEGPVYERYLGVVANVGTAALTAGSVNAFLTANPPKWKAYADAI